MVGRVMSYRERIQSVLNRIVKVSDLQEGNTFRFEAERTKKNAYEVAFRIANGYSYNHVKRQLSALTATCGGVVELDDRGGVIYVRVFMEDLPEKIPIVPGMFTPGKVLLGYDRYPEPVYHNWKNPHMIIGSETGWGKTELIRLIIYQLGLNHTPDELEIHIIDLKAGVSFLPFRKMPHITNIAYDLETARDTLRDAYFTMVERGQEVRDIGTRSAFKNYKQRILIIDEAAQMAPTQISDKKDRAIATEADRYLASISCVGREIGLNIIYCTQYPHSDVINSQVKINCGARISFHVPAAVNSFVILNAYGAEKLMNKGRALYKTTGPMQEIQVPYLEPEQNHKDNDSAWEKLIQPLQSEVIEDGMSERKPHDRIIIDAECAAIGDNGADRPADVQGPRQPGKASIRIALGFGRGEAGRVPTDGRHAQGMAAQQARSSGSRMLKTSGTYEHDQDSSLVDDW
jgi:hypothetical protein